MATAKSLVEEFERSKFYSEELQEKLEMHLEICNERLEQIEREMKQFIKNQKDLGNGIISTTGNLECVKQLRFIKPDTDPYLIPYIQACVDRALGENIQNCVKYSIALKVSQTLDLLLGIFEGKEQIAQGYFVALDGIMNLVRIDYSIYCRRNYPGTLDKLVKYTVGCVTVKSNIDVSKTDFYDFCAIYQQIFLDGFPEGISRAEQLKIISEELKSIKEIYEIMGGIVPQNNRRRQLSGEMELVHVSPAASLSVEEN